MKKTGKLIWSMLIAFGLFALVYWVIIPSFNHEWVSYHNPVYGYNISYPEDWELYDDAPDYPDYVGIFSEDDFAVIAIEVSCDMWSLDESVAFFIANTVNHWDDAQIQSSFGPVNSWDWIIEYEYTYEDTHMLAKGYLLQSAECTFVLSYNAGISSVWRPGEQHLETFDSHYLCEDVIDTFQLISQ